MQNKRRGPTKAKPMNVNPVTKQLFKEWKSHIELHAFDTAKCIHPVLHNILHDLIRRPDWASYSIEVAIE